ncbi:cytochrome c oxidase subunit II [Fredinandcohnia quinoae]|uniref:Cytochrome c oxidase subunit 2 n=1 Tax=Fredinandcohnia quinoae TaxID=2918902 RepID=A0AAW5E2W2_9BACI|nr:cytochrome c oxidase subunit II [Fredinandcohnia sp. SECRCQ15]MCH1623920.1 cytochrome c oxidase subunit II [Fredinandcohnia sp. SECRCQ15]
MKKWLPNMRLFSLFSFIALLLAGCGEPTVSALRPAGEVADMQYDLIMLAVWIMVVVIAVVTVIFIYVVFRFRRKKGEENKIPKQVEGNHTLEIIWTVIPILLLLILVVPTVSATFKLADVKAMDDKDALVVNVTSNLYWWEFEYPNQKIVTSQDLIVPTDEKVYFNLISSDVKHSFWIPAIGGKLDTNTDNTNKFWLEFDSERTKDAGGIFYGKCAELCGPSHALMDFKVKPLPRDEFDKWIENMQNAKAEAKTDLAKAGEELFKNNNCIACHAITPGDKSTAPNLANFGDRSSIAGRLTFTEDNLKKWIKDPEEVKPGNKMSGSYDNKGLTNEELDALAEYLMGLSVED